MVARINITSDAESKSAKILNSLYGGGGGGGVGGAGTQFPTFDAESKSVKIHFILA